MLKTVPRFIAVAFVASVLAFSAAGPVLAASTIASVRVDTQNDGAVVTVAFAAQPPPFRVTGAGTPEVAIVFPGARTASTVPPGIAGVGPVASATIALGPNSTTVSLHLIAGAQVRVHGFGNNVVADVFGASAAPTLPTLVAPTLAAPAALAPGSETLVIPLKYADVSEIAGVLVPGANVATNDTFSPTQSNIGTSSLGGSFGGNFGSGGLSSGGFNGSGITSASSAAFNPAGGLGGGGGLAQRISDNIAIDRRLNAIILTGTPDVLAPFESMIDKLDIQVPSVMLETQIVELSDSAARNVGLDASPDGSGIIANASGGPGLLVKTGGFPVGQVAFNAALYAQIQEGNGRVISKPRILAQSGQQASILTGDAIPIITQVVSTGVAAVTGSQVTYINVGVNLQIQPRVSSDGFVTSHIYSEVSSVTGYTQGVPTISQRTTSTTATVRDSDSFVIGGLLQDNELRNLSKLPYVSDIPLIGQLFKHVNTTKSQTNLYIIVTPHIIATSDRPAAPPKGLPIALPSLLPQSSPLPGPPAPHASASPYPAQSPNPNRTQAGPHRSQS